MIVLRMMRADALISQITEQEKLLSSLWSRDSLNDYVFLLAFDGVTTYKPACYSIAPYCNSSHTTWPPRRAMGILTVNDLPYCLLHLASLEFSALGRVFDSSFSHHSTHLLGTHLVLQCGVIVNPN